MNHPTLRHPHSLTSVLREVRSLNRRLLAGALTLASYCASVKPMVNSVDAGWLPVVFNEARFLMSVH